MKESERLAREIENKRAEAGSKATSLSTEERKELLVRAKTIGPGAEKDNKVIVDDFIRRAPVLRSVESAAKPQAAERSMADKTVAAIKKNTAVEPPSRLGELTPSPTPAVAKSRSAGQGK